MEVRFADVVVDTDTMQLERAGAAVRVEPQVFDVLAYLIEHRDRMVPKTELLDEIWGDRFVSDSALSSRIKSARQAIGDNGRDQRLIRTVHGRGFRFVGDVEVDDGRTPAETVPADAVPAETGDRGAVARQVLEGLRRGRGRALEIVSDASAARREVVDDVLFAASADGILTGRGGGASEVRAYGSIGDALDELVGRSPELLDDIPPRCRAELEAVTSGASPNGGQRLFVAVQELLAAAGRAGGAVVAIEDVHLIDRSTLDLIDHMARTARRVGVALLVTHRAGFSLPGGLERIEIGGGGAPGLMEVPAALRGPLARAAAAGEPLPRSVFAAATALDPDAADRALALAVAEGILVEARDGVRFADSAVAGTLAQSLPERERDTVLRAVAAQLVADGGDPAAIARCLDEAGEVQDAAVHHLEAATTAAWSQLHGEVLRHTAGVDAVDDPAVRGPMLELRADALAAGGDPEAIGRYREALRSAAPEQVPWLRARLGRAHLIVGDVEAAAEALDGVEPSGSPVDGGIMLIRGMLAYFEDDLDAAEELAATARELALAPGAPPQMLDVIALQGMIAHSRGEWFDRLRRELRANTDSSELASTVFDSHLCVAQFLLYGPTGHDEVIRLASELREAADRMGSPRVAGFAMTLEGEAMLLSGDLGRAREALSRSVEIQREIGADTGLAHALQRLADVALAEGERREAEALCRQALPLARWSPLSRHLMQRIAGTLIAAAPDPTAAAAAADDAFATIDDPTACPFCQVMVAVPACMAYASAGRLDDARAQLAVAERSANLWEGPAWPAAVSEARAVVAVAEGRGDDADRLFREAADGFTAAGQPHDAARCLEAVGSS